MQLQPFRLIALDDRPSLGTIGHRQGHDHALAGEVDPLHPRLDTDLTAVATDVTLVIEAMSVRRIGDGRLLSFHAGEVHANARLGDH